MATKRVSAYLNPKMVLKDVLYAAKLNCNLISIGKLIKDVYCIVTFTNKLCMILDSTIRSPIRVSEFIGLQAYGGVAGNQDRCHRD